ncbi:DUF885 family protein [candidate division KSB1 bacterium]|nr:DUF885 family protein [candidate division KSB1 bacterium]
MIRRIRLIVLIAGLIVSVYSCGKLHTQHQFESVAESICASYLSFHPVNATMLGDYSYNNQLDDCNTKAVQSRIHQLKTFQLKLKSLDYTELDSTLRIDFTIVDRAVRNELWELETVVDRKNNPCLYSHTLYDAIYGIINNDGLPVDVRCEYLFSRLRQIPRFLQTAQSQLSAARDIQLKEADDELAALQLMMSDAIPQIAIKSTGLHDSLVAVTRESLNEITFFRTWLRQYADSLSRPERLNIEQYRAILEHRYSLSEDIFTLQKQFVSKDSSIHLQIDDALDNVYHTFYRRRRDLPDPDELLKKVLERIENQYVQDDLLLVTAQDYWLNIQQFLDVKMIFPSYNVDDILIQRANPWERNSELVWLVSSGALSHLSQNKLLIKSMPAGQNWYGQLAFLRQLNRTALHVIVASQLLPGKLLIEKQLQSYPSGVRQTFPDQSLLSGWPLMALDILCNTGYDGYSSQFRFGVLLLKLRTISCALADIKYHSDGMERNVVQQWLMDQAYLKENQAAEYMNDILLNPGKYVVPAWGYLTIQKLYQQARVREGNLFNRIKFIDQLTSKGPIPLSLIYDRFQN